MEAEGVPSRHQTLCHPWRCSNLERSVRFTEEGRIGMKIMIELEEALELVLSRIQSVKTEKGN